MPVILGEDFQASGISDLLASPTVVGGPMQIEGDAPNRHFMVQVRNIGPNTVAVYAQESVNGTVWIPATDQAGSALPGIVGLHALCEAGFHFIVRGNANWIRLVSVGVTDLLLKLENFQRAPVNL